MFKTILVPLDGSNLSEKALDVACDLANRYHSDLHLIHASDYLRVMAGIPLAESALLITQEDYEKPSRELLASAVAKAARLGCNSVTPHYLSDSPSKAIVEIADEIDADLIAMGAEGHSDISGVLLGSVSHRVCNTANRSCLIVH